MGGCCCDADAQALAMGGEEHVDVGVVGGKRVAQVELEHAAIHLEDQVTPKRCGHMSGVRLVTADEMMRRLAAIMFTDIVGYTKLMGFDEKKAFELLNKNRSIQK